MKLTHAQIGNIRLVFKVPYLYTFLAVIVIFSFLNFYLNEIYVIGFKLFRFNLFISIPYLIFTSLNTILIGLSFTLAHIRFKSIGIVTPHTTFLSFLGSFFAILTGACPGCVSGLLPVFAGFFGTTFNLNSLPFYGIEIQFLSCLLLLIGIYQLSKEVVCKV